MNKKINLNSRFLKKVNLKKWYEVTYPGEDIIKSIKPAATFADALKGIKTGQLYSLIGVADSCLRSRIFNQLALYSAGYNNYDDLYCLWLKHEDDD